jgi:hypothetical protein
LKFCKHLKSWWDIHHFIPSILEALLLGHWDSEETDPVKDCTDRTRNMREPRQSPIIYQWESSSVDFDPLRNYQ